VLLRACICVVVAVAFLALGEAAFAYPAPTGLGSSTTLCPPRPSDLSTAVSTPSAPYSATVPAGATVNGPAISLEAGEVELFVEGGPGAYAELEVQDSSGNWQFADFLATGPASTIFAAASAEIEVPSGPARIELGNTTSSPLNVYSYITTPSADVGENYAAQELADACQLTVADAAAAHTDSGTLATSLSTLAEDVTQLDHDVNSDSSSEVTAIHGISGGSGPASTVTVANEPADQTVGLDASSQTEVDGDAEALHDDLWTLVGVIVGCFLFGIVLQKVWP
jgi:hypothetical protein